MGEKEVSIKLFNKISQERQVPVRKMACIIFMPSKGTRNVLSYNRSLGLMGVTR